MTIVRCFNLPLTPDFSQVFTSNRGFKTVSTVWCVRRETVETVPHVHCAKNTPLKQGVNERRFA